MTPHAHAPAATEVMAPATVPARFRAYGPADLPELPQLSGLSEETRLAMRVVAQVFPFRVNDHVLSLIDWDDVPDDPIFQMTFPQRGMLDKHSFDALAGLIRRGASREQVRARARRVQLSLNPHPAGQATLNVPQLGAERVQGIQHKYRETVLFFPTEGQTCHAYCGYCFRWPQFVKLGDLKFASREADRLVDYLEAHQDVTSVLFTGGDPLIMKTSVLRRYIEPLLAAADRLPHLATIRLGTKAPAYWPQRFTSDADSDDLLRLFEEVARAGLQVAVMAHYSHPRELETPVAQEALRRIRSAGATVRCQAPLMRHVNDDPTVWSDMWRLQVRLGAVPYYLFVARDTGPRTYFEVPLARAFDIFREAYSQVSGLARTVRGPSMSATPGKVVVDGTPQIEGRRVFALRFLQAREPQWVGRPFFAEYDDRATWLDQLRPAFGAERFFFEEPTPWGPSYGAAAWTRPTLTRRVLPVLSEVAS